MILALATASLAPALQAVGWALLHLVWQGAAIAVVLALLLALLPARSANVRYAISCAALALVVVVGVLTGLRSYAAGAPQAPALAHRADRQVVPAPVDAPAPPPVAAIVVATFAPARVASMPDPWRVASDALPAIVSLWLAGVTLLSLRLIVQWGRARRLVTEHAQPACEPWLAMARKLGAALGVRRAVRLLESTVVQVPAVVGLLRPVILLPANTLSGLLPGQLEMILAHELAHIRRHDFLVNLLQAAVETLLFYHPAVWWISKQARIEREHCCDDLAVSVCGNPLQYARALTRLEELRAAPLPLALSARGGSLFHRIHRVVGGPAASTGPVRGVTALALLSGLLLAFAGPSLTAIAKPQPASSAKSPRTAARAAEANRTAASSATANATACRDGEAATSLAGTVVQAMTGLDPDPDLDPGVDPDPNSNAAIASGHLRLTVDELIELRSQGVTTADILEMRSLFPRIDIRDIAGMYAVGATPEYVHQMRAAGINVRSAKAAQGMAAVGVTPEFIADMRAAGLEVESADDAAGLAAVGVTSEFVRGMRTAGLAIESADDAKGLAAVGVTPEFIADMRAAGLTIESADDAKGLAAVGVTPDYVRDMRATGLTLASADDAKGLAAVGVTPEFVRGMRAAGLTIESADDAKGLAAVGVTPDYIREMRATGLTPASADEAKSLAAVGVTADYVREMRAAGVPLRGGDDARSLIVVGVTPDFVRQLARAGYKKLDIRQLQRLGASGLSGGFVEEMAKYRTH